MIFGLSQPQHVTASHPSPDDNHQSKGGRSERSQGQSKMAAWNSIRYIIMHQGCALFSIFRALSRSLNRHSSVAQGHLHTIHPPHLWLPRTRPPLTSAINTLLAIRFLYILTAGPNHLNTLWSSLLANSHSLPALLFTYSFLIQSIRDKHI